MHPVFLQPAKSWYHVSMFKLDSCHTCLLPDSTLGMKKASPSECVQHDQMSVPAETSNDLIHSKAWLSGGKQVYHASLHASECLTLGRCVSSMCMRIGNRLKLVSAETKTLDSIDQTDQTRWWSFQWIPNNMNEQVEETICLSLSMFHWTQLFRCSLSPAQWTQKEKGKRLRHTWEDSARRDRLDSGIIIDLSVILKYQWNSKNCLTHY